MEKYIYTKEHIPTLKKYCTAKIVFLLLGCLVLLLQSISWLVVWLKDIDISISSMVFVGITLVFALSFVGSQFFFAVRTKNIIKLINSEGKFITMRIRRGFSDKTSWGGALTVLARVIAVLFVIFLGILIVSFVQNYLNWGKIILKMPLMVFCAVWFLNMSAELRFQSMIETAKK